MNLCAFAMRPHDRNFRNFEVEALGEIQDFGIESPALNVLQREDRLGRRAGKRLESALRVFETQP